MNLDIDKIRRKLRTDWIGTNSIVEIEDKVTEFVCFVFNSKMIEFIDQFLQNESNMEISYEKLMIEATHKIQFHINDHFYFTNNKQTLLETGNLRNDSIVFRKGLIEKTEYFKKNSTCFDNNNLQICQKNSQNLKQKFTRSISDPCENVKKCNSDDQTHFKSFFALNSSQNIFKIYITSSEYNSNRYEVTVIKYQNKIQENSHFAEKTSSVLRDLSQTADNASDETNRITNSERTYEIYQIEDYESSYSNKTVRDAAYFRSHYKCAACGDEKLLGNPYLYENYGFLGEEPHFFIGEICDDCRRQEFNSHSSTETSLFRETDSSIMRKFSRIRNSPRRVDWKSVICNFLVLICIILFGLLISFEDRIMN
ncbi:hypothetical protein EDEG_03113, partial [Edhazardia aedis USNM 41457]